MALAAGLLLGLVADAAVPDPQRGHPVAAFGTSARWLERRLWRPNRAAGVAHLIAATVLPAAFAGVLDRRVRRIPVARLTFVAALAWTVLGASGLHREARSVETAIRGGELDGARQRLRSLCGRDPSLLDATGLRAAAIESVAENTSDAAVAPLLWGALAGPAGLVGYRAVNTLDAMVGHRDARYERFGFAAARLDDLLNLLPARLTGMLSVTLAPMLGLDSDAAWRAWRRDARLHPSPNAGVCEAVFAGALGLRLGGPTVYGYGVSNRPWLGAGGAPGHEDIARAIALSRCVIVAAAVACALGSIVTAKR